MGMTRKELNDILELKLGDMGRDARRVYLETQVRGSNPQQLLQLLYEGLTRYLLAGRASLEERRWEEAARNLGKARNIVSYLIQLLRPEGGDISRHLRRLYAFCFENISLAILEQSPDRVDGVLKVVRELSSAWNELARKTAAERD